MTRGSKQSHLLRLCIKNHFRMLAIPNSTVFCRNADITNSISNSIINITILIIKKEMR